MTFDEFCKKNNITSGNGKEDFLEFCAEDLELEDDEEEIPNQSEEWFESAYEDFKDTSAESENC